MNGWYLFSPLKAREYNRATTNPTVAHYLWGEHAVCDYRMDQSRMNPQEPCGIKHCRVCEAKLKKMKKNGLV